MIRRQPCVLRSSAVSRVSTTVTSSLSMGTCSTRSLLVVPTCSNCLSSIRSFHATPRWLEEKKSSTSSETVEEETTSTKKSLKKSSSSSTTSSSNKKSSSSASSSSTAAEEKATEKKSVESTSAASEAEAQTSSSSSSSTANAAAAATAATTDGAAKTSNEPKSESSSSSSGVVKRDESAPVLGTVEEYSRVARAEENRLEVIEAEIWNEESCYHPILARGKQNVYEHTDDIPKDVKPMFGDTQIWQTREYFEYRRKAEDIRYKIMSLGSGLLLFFGLAGAVAFTRIWIDQPNEVATIRRDVLSHSYGRVLELAAGQGINIGIYPYAVTDVVLMDSNPQELHILRSRLPRTAYPTYQVVCDKAEELAAFPDNCFDTVVDMFGLCHYKDPVKVLKQMQRVCKPTGSILLIEHGKTKYAAVNWFLDWYADKHYEKTNGCQWNKDLMAIFKEAGLVIRNIDTQHYGTTHIVIAHPEVSAEAPLLAGGQPAPAIMF